VLAVYDTGHIIAVSPTLARMLGYTAKGLDPWALRARDSLIDALSRGPVTRWRSSPPAGTDVPDPGTHDAPGGGL
jgi:hypothetical protein